MTPETPDLQTLLQRVESLERHNRRLNRFGLAALLVTSAVLFMGQATHRNRAVEAEEFKLLDSTGKTRAELSMVGDGPALKMYDAHQRFRVAISIHQNIPLLGLYDPTGIARIGLTSRVEDGPSLWFGDVNGKPQAQLDAIGEHPRLYLQDKNGLAASVGDDTVQNLRTGETENTSAASVVLFSAGRKVVWRAP